MNKIIKITFTYLLIALLCGFLEGCASSYKPTANMLKIKESMDRKIALEALNKLFNENTVRQGLDILPGGNRWYLSDDCSITATVDRLIFTKSYKDGKFIGQKYVHRHREKLLEKTYETIQNNEPIEVMYSSLTKIRVSFRIRMKNKNWLDRVDFHANSGVFMSYLVDIKETDTLLAAISFIMPEVEIEDNIGLM